MTTFASPSLHPEPPDQQSPDDPSSDVMAIDSGINGVATDHNAIHAFAPPPPPDEPITNGTSHTQSPAHSPEPIAPSAPDGIAVEPSKGEISDEHICEKFGESATAAPEQLLHRNEESQLPSRPAEPSAPPPEPAQTDTVSTEHSHAETNVLSSEHLDTPVNRAAESTGESLASVKTSEEQNVSVPAQVIVGATVQPDQTLASSSVPPADPPDATASGSQIVPASAPLEAPPQSVSSEAPPNQEATTASVAPSKVREREEDDGDEGPSAKRPKTDGDATSDGDLKMTDAPVQGTSEQQLLEAAAAPHPSPADLEAYGTMSETQKKRLLDGIRNIKKGKNSKAFLRPVDYVTLNLTTYPTIIKHPMDLGTMEHKLKGDAYNSVADYIADFDKMVHNSITFNGQGHAVSQAGMMLRSHLNSQLKKVPKAGELGDGEGARSKKPRKSSGSEPNRESKRRGPRPSLGAAPSAADQTPHAPGPDGVPLIRRDSTVGDRPKRKIQKPPPRDLSYPKPVKKKFQSELKFCANVLEEMQRPRYNAISAPFLHPVDPVALSIPEYFKVIKKPMDVSTVSDKLNSGQYENAKEFEADFRQIFANCYKFNPVGNAVRSLGQQYEELFDDQWSKKQAYLAEQAPTPGPQTPEMESEEEADEEEENEEDDKDAKIAALHQQLIALQEQTSSLMGKSAGKGNTKKSAKPAGGKGTTKQKKTSLGGTGAVPKQEKKSKPKQPKQAKPPRPTSQKEKQEIANRISELSPDDIEKAASIIRASLRKAGKHELADRAENEMEFEIENIPEDALHDLLKLVRSKLGPPVSVHKTQTYASPEPVASQPSKKGRKNKPMSELERGATLSRLESQLESFNKPNGQVAEFANDANESSGDDDDDSGSESEEE